MAAAIVPGLERRPRQKLGSDPDALLKLLRRWQMEAGKSGHPIRRICVAYEAGRDGFWLARWLRKRGIEAFVMHAASLAVPRERRRAKTDRLDTALLMRAFLGWLRGEPDHCRMAAIPTLAEEDGRCPNRERDHLVAERTRVINRIKSILARLGIRDVNPGRVSAAEGLATLRTPDGEAIPPNMLGEVQRDLTRRCFLDDQIKEIEQARLERLRQEPGEARNAMVLLLARVVGIGVETADMLVHEILSRHLRDRRAVARYAGLTGTPDESGKRRREKGLSKAGNARVRRGMIQLAWRFLLFQAESDLAKWFHARTAGAKRGSKVRKTMIVALARKLLVALWSFATTGAVPAGVTLRAA